MEPAPCPYAHMNSRSREAGGGWWVCWFGELIESGLAIRLATRCGLLVFRGGGDHVVVLTTVEVQRKPTYMVNGLSVMRIEPGLSVGSASGDG